MIRYANESGFAVKHIQFVEGRPEYLRLTAFTYLFDLVYELIVNATDLFAQFPRVMISELEKPS